MRQQRGQRGFTLIELLIVIAIVGILAAAAVPAINSVTGANARAAASELAGAARYLFDTAALRHQTCRLVLKLDDSTWSAECTKERFFAGREKSDVATHEDEDESALEDRFPDERDAEKRKLLAKAKFGQFSDRLSKGRSLPGNSHFVDVWAEHQREPASKGVVYIYFYPHGQAEAARIPIADGDNVYSIVTQPFTGRAKVVNGKPELPKS